MGNHSKILHIIYKCVTKSVKILGGTFPKTLEPKNVDLNFAISVLFASNSRVEQNIINRKSALKTADTPLGF